MVRILGRIQATTAAVIVARAHILIIFHSFPTWLLTVVGRRCHRSILIVNTHSYVTPTREKRASRARTFQFNPHDDDDDSHGQLEPLTTIDGDDVLCDNGKLPWQAVSALFSIEGLDLDLRKRNRSRPCVLLPTTSTGVGFLPRKRMYYYDVVAFLDC